MSDQKPDWVKAAEVVRDAGGRIVGRTKLQKVAYLLELCGLGSGFQFEYRHYGPYSEDLADGIQMADAFGLVIEDERLADWGGKYSIYTATEHAGTVASTGQRTIFAKAAAEIKAVELELAATAAYLSAVEGSQSPWEETKRLKPDKADYARVQAAKQAYRRLRKLPVPTSLPDI